MIQVDNPLAILSQVLISVNHRMERFHVLFFNDHDFLIYRQICPTFFMTFHLKVADILNSYIKFYTLTLAHPHFPKSLLRDRLNVADFNFGCVHTTHQMKMQFCAADYLKFSWPRLVFVTKRRCYRFTDGRKVRKWPNCHTHKRCDLPRKVWLT